MIVEGVDLRFSTPPTASAIARKALERQI